jgi:hypothetical protein
MPTTPSWKPCVEHADGRRRRRDAVAVVVHGEQRLGQQQRLVAHAALDVAPLAVDAVEHARQLFGAARVVGQQALDAQRHVGQPAGRVDARAQGKAEVEGGGHRRRAARGLEERGHARGHGAGADAAQALRHQAAVVGVELHHVGHGAERDQRQQRIELGLRGHVEHAAPAQLGAQRQQHIEHHADAGDALALELAAGLVGVDQHVGHGQLGAGQVVVGDQHLQAARLGGGHAVDAGDAVVHGDQHVGAAVGHALGNGRREAVAVDHAVGHQVVTCLAPSRRRPRTPTAQAVAPSQS